jgi:hypothetical protein
VDHLWGMSTREARRLLPAMQAAVLTVAAGSERAERILDPPDPEEPRRPFCANCDEGRVDSARNPHPNPWCEKYGHEPFGVLDGRQGAWDCAERRYREHRAALEEVSYLAGRRRRDRS